MNPRVSTVFIDALFLMLLFLVLLPHRPDEAAADDTHAGDLVIEIAWPDCQNSDVDLWVKSPGDRPVGYSRTRGADVSLMRDDLGSALGCAREELAASRVLTDGEWIVNVHLFTDSARAAPFRVSIIVWYRGNSGLRTTVWAGFITLSRVGDEVTAVRWKMADGRMVPGSVHHSPVALRGSGAMP